MKYQNVLIGLVACFAPLSLSMAQTCNDAITPTTTPEQFVLNTDGTITGVKYGLQWQICSVGQSFDPALKKCQGSPTSFTTWKDALAAAQEQSEFAGKDDWRLPNIKELSTIVEYSCYDPAIDLASFPDTPSAVFWSNTPDNKVNAGINGRIINFKNGSEFLTVADQYRFVRLVRKL